MTSLLGVDCQGGSVQHVVDCSSWWQDDHEEFARQLQKLLRGAQHAALGQKMCVHSMAPRSGHDGHPDIVCNQQDMRMMSGHASLRRCDIALCEQASSASVSKAVRVASGEAAIAQRGTNTVSRREPQGKVPVAMAKLPSELQGQAASQFTLFLNR